MKVVEIFTSINGESKRAGELAVFVRFAGCNLNCAYCDTKWANEPDTEYKDMTPKEIADYVIKQQVTNVTITGGEPLLQKNIEQLVALLMESGHRVEIETNGSVDIDSIAWSKRPSFTVDYKSPSSGCESKMFMDNYSKVGADDVVKFVVGSKEDLDKARDIIKQYHLDQKSNVFVSPVWGDIEPAQIVEYMIENKLNDIKLQIQMHKIVWDPDKRGV